MILNQAEYALMNNFVRAWLQRHVEARRLLKMGGRMAGGKALEIGCGRGIGIRLVLDIFGAESVDAFDLDPRMVRQARTRFVDRRAQVRVWVGDASEICLPNSTYDAVFDFGIIHHVPNWRATLTEIFRVLKPGGCLYAEEVFKGLITNPVARRIAKHPQSDRFDSSGFLEELRSAGFEQIATRELWGQFGWYFARKSFN